MLREIQICFHQNMRDEYRPKSVSTIQIGIPCFPSPKIGPIIHEPRKFELHDSGPTRRESGSIVGLASREIL